MITTKQLRLTGSPIIVTNCITIVNKMSQVSIIVNVAGKNYGPYTKEQVAKCIQDGSISEHDFAWMDSANEWISVKEALERLRPPRPKLVEEVLDEIKPEPVIKPKQRTTRELLMSRILIQRNGQNYGPYTIPQIKECLEINSIYPQDLAMVEGDSTWTTVQEALEALTPKGGGHSDKTSLMLVKRTSGRVSVWR